MTIISLLPPFLAVIFSPLLLGLVNRTKAFVAGRRGPPLFQAYWDIGKLLRKGAVYSRTTSWIFRAGPVAGLSAMLVAAAVMPFGRIQALIAFPGDLVLFAYLLALERFFTISAALDTGSSFEGMGASREAQFAVLAEPALFLAVAALAVNAGSFSLSGILDPAPLAGGPHPGTVRLLACAALAVVFLAENARIPVDDPNTHLELTMIHEVMVLDHSGPDLAFILYTDALKLWCLGALVVGTALAPLQLGGWQDIAVWLAAMAALAAAVGIIESSMARLRLSRVPHLLVGASAAAVLALGLAMR